MTTCKTTGVPARHCTCVNCLKPTGPAPTPPTDRNSIPLREHAEGLLANAGWFRRNGQEARALQLQAAAQALIDIDIDSRLSAGASEQRPGSNPPPPAGPKPAPPPNPPSGAEECQYCKQSKIAYNGIFDKCCELERRLGENDARLPPGASGAADESTSVTHSSHSDSSRSSGNTAQPGSENTSGDLIRQLRDWQRLCEREDRAWDANLLARAALLIEKLSPSPEPSAHCAVCDHLEELHAPFNLQHAFVAKSPAEPSEKATTDRVTAVIRDISELEYDTPIGQGHVLQCTEEELRIILDRHFSHEPRNELGWLVEAKGATGALWLMLSPSESGDRGAFRDWTRDASKALRFCRKEDAESFISAHMPMMAVHATEHMWCSGPSPSTKRDNDGL